MCRAADNIKISPYPSLSEIRETNSDYYAILFDQGQIGPLESHMSLTVAQKQKFTIKEISPEWGYATEATKVYFIMFLVFLCSFYNWGLDDQCLSNLKLVSNQLLIQASPDVSLLQNKNKNNRSIFMACFIWVR